MPVTFKELDFRTSMPDVPRDLPVLEVAGQCFDDRSNGIRVLARQFDLGDATEVDLPFGWALASRSGQVEYFEASGAIRGRNSAVTERFENESRHWPGAVRYDTREGTSWGIGESAEGSLVERSRSLAADIRLDADPVDVRVSVAQWAKLDESGKELDSGPGRATVQMSYAFEGLPFIGPGSKTNMHYDPIDGEPQLSRFFHVHRSPGRARSVRAGEPERAFDGLLDDALLVEHAGRASRIAITTATLGLLSLPADVPQRYAVPALAVEGSIEGLVDPEGRDYELRFGRYIQVVDARSLASAGIAIAPEITRAAVERSDEAPRTEP